MVLYGSETLSLKLKEKYGLLENRVLRRLFGPKRAKVTRDWRKVHSEEIQNLYSIKSIG
jgi:hypothetical protein